MRATEYSLKRPSRWTNRVPSGSRITLRPVEDRSRASGDAVAGARICSGEARTSLPVAGSIAILRPALVAVTVAGAVARAAAWRWRAGFELDVPWRTALALVAAWWRDAGFRRDSAPLAFPATRPRTQRAAAADPRLRRTCPA